MEKARPVVYLFHGEDEFGIAQAVSQMETRLGDPTTAALNTTRLDGRRLTLDELRMATGAMPFLADRRLVIVQHPLAAFAAAGTKDAFKKLLDGLPVTTALVLVEDHTLEDSALERFSYRKIEDHWLVAWAKASQGRGYLKNYAQLEGPALVKWIQDQARAEGGEIARPAAEALADLVGTDNRTAAQEMHKLLAYVNYQRPVEAADVEKLSVTVAQEKVFGMLDALLAQDAAQASARLRRLLSEEDYRSIFGMLVRQFRLLLAARDMLDRGEQIEAVVRVMGVKPYKLYSKAARALVGQAQQYPFKGLKEVYHCLLDMDAAIKQGEADEEVALETFVAAFTNRRPAGGY